MTSVGDLTEVMDQESWLSCEKTAVLQGGFLLANQLCQPEPLLSLKKEDWDRIGRPIVNAVKEICEHSLKDTKDRFHWRKRILCIVWSKILEVRNKEDINIRWKEDPLFAVQNSLPDINHTVLFELVKSMSFSTIYVELLMCFQPAERCEELKLLVDHVSSSSTETDAKLLLEVWWELLKGKRGCLDALDQLFTAHFSLCMTEPSPLASKRFKPDPESTCVVHVLFEGLRKIKEHLTSSELCYFALSNCLDTLYTNYLLGNTADLSIEMKLQSISRTVSLKKRNEGLDDFDLIEIIREAQRDLAATLTPAETKPCGMTFIQAMQVTLEIICSWEVMGLLKMPSNDPSVMVMRLKDSLDRVLTSLEHRSHAKDLVGNGQTLNNLLVTLKGLTASLSFTVPESSAAEVANMSITILDHHLEGFEGLPGLFASKLSQNFSQMEWIQCLERNGSLFQTKELLITLISTLTAKCQSDADVKYCKKLKDIIVNLFSHLSLSDKNATLSEMLSISKKGLHGFLPSSVTIGFSEELNLAFNSIIQSGANSSLDAAVSAVARVAFQNPEATLRRCCHMAVVNLGAHALIAEILQQLSGLTSSPAVQKDNLLCRCLQDTVWSKLSSLQEENQFLQFLAELMKCNITGSTGEKLSFLPPEEVLHAFVQPYLLPASSSSSNLEFCLRLLQCTLNQETTSDSVHWIMSCSPFPLLYCLAQLLNECSRCWDQPLESEIHISMESKELLLSVLHTLGIIVGKEVAHAPDSWSRALFWLYSKVEELDWTVRFYLKDVWGNHFKYEVPNSLLSVCDLPEQEWSGLDLPQYGQGTGLVAWFECCALSDHVHDAMLESLSLNLMKPDEVNMFGKGLLVASCQILPWCTSGEWERLLKVLQELLESDQLYVPYSLEYVDFLPLLNLRSFANELRLSVFLLRIFQLLCSSSCSDWLPPQGWAHTGRLYANAMRGIIRSVTKKIPTTPTPKTEKIPSPPFPNTEKIPSPPSPKIESIPTMPSPKTSGACSQEVLFVLTQLFCHVLHVQVMIPGQPEALFLCALEILTNYEAVLSAYPDSCTALQGLNTRHFFTTITDNLNSADMKAALHQKIAQL
ncbi:gem-associated protein 4 [Puntigrus tetrazona]|uniref:gem-associated protein 4 n=1 Tax=Puntigrus tetrazona TaxID=1606681 RepID=UPI001C8A3072|nr:gem-associated protein 4 [Puntigrus tetrazona]